MFVHRTRNFICLSVGCQISYVYPLDTIFQKFVQRTPNFICLSVGHQISYVFSKLSSVSLSMFTLCNIGNFACFLLFAGF